jgi:replicative DNA helicase
MNMDDEVLQGAPAPKTFAPKVPPHSLEAERSVLGALMLDNNALDKIVDRILINDFYRVEHRFIYESILQLADKSQPFDVLTVAETLSQQQKLNVVGGDTYLYELVQNTPSAANITAYADIVRERAVLRQLITAANDIVSNAFNPQGQASRDVLDEAERRVLAIAEARDRGHGPQALAHLLAKATDRIDTLYHSDDTITGLPTGFSQFDEMTSGLQDGDLVIIAGRPSMGKTTYAMNIAEYAAMKADKPVLIFSMEMPAEQLTMRMLSSLGRIDQHKVRTGKLDDDDWARITSAVSMLAEAKMYIDDTPALSPTELRSRSRRVAREHEGLSLIVIDYLQLMQIHGHSENRTNEISEISRSLKAIAKELSVPVIALSQLNRSLESRTDKRPVMSDLRESGAIEQDADLIAFIYRDEVYNEDSPDKGMAEIIIRKQRNGPIGDFRLTFLGQYTRFENYINTGVDIGEFV